MIIFRISEPMRENFPAGPTHIQTQFERPPEDGRSFCLRLGGRMCVVIVWEVKFQWGGKGS